MIAHFDCFAGASGDMILASLIDAGSDLETMNKELSLLGDVWVETETVHRAGIRGLRAEVRGELGGFTSYRQAETLIEGAGFDEAVSASAIRVIRRLAEAEARVHGTSLEQSHLHEVGGADTIVDALGMALALRQLDVQSVTSSPVAVGSGLINTSHGALPNPAPATIELLRETPVYQREIQAELVTPTGAALLTEWASSFGPMPPISVRSVGYGAGTRELEIPNLLRVVIGEGSSRPIEDIEELVVEATIDDMNPEIYPYVTEKLTSAGASDVWISPATGKHGRPSTILTAMVPPPLQGSVVNVLISETSTLGVRITSARKMMLDRRWEEVWVGDNRVRLKIATNAGRVVNVAPEYADCAEVARKTGMPLKEVFRLAAAAWPSSGSPPAT